MNDKLKTDIQYILPKHLITKVVGLLASARLGFITTLMIRKFIQHYNINTNEAEYEPEDYTTFNDFFARSLRKNARPIDKREENYVFPADGKISQFGTLNKNIMIQAKNHYYSAETLLASAEDGKIFENGSFITIYLSPRDYHHVHIPFGGTLEKMTHIPGELFSVNRSSAKYIPELFARNERVACIFNTKYGKMAVIMVGATIVRSISTIWAGTIHSKKEVTTTDYSNHSITFSKGTDIGKFSMGSTVICLFEKDKIDFNDTLQEGQPTKVGRPMATLKNIKRTLSSQSKKASPTKTKKSNKE